MSRTTCERRWPDSARRRETALEGPENVAIYRDALLDSMEESERLLTMLNTLMDISEAETGLMRLDRQLFPLAPLVAEIVELFELVAEDKGITQTSRSAGRPGLLCGSQQTPASAGEPARQRAQIHALRRKGENLRALRDRWRRHRLPGFRHRHLRGGRAQDLGSPLSRRQESFAAWTRARPQPGAGLRQRARRAGGGAEHAGAGFDLYRVSAHDASPGAAGQPARSGTGAGMTRSICARATQPERPSAVRTRTKLRSTFFAVTISPFSQRKNRSGAFCGRDERGDMGIHHHGAAEFRPA